MLSECWLPDWKGRRVGRLVIAPQLGHSQHVRGTTSSLGLDLLGSGLQLLASWGFWNRSPPSRWLHTTEVYSLLTWSRKSKLRVSRGPLPAEGSRRESLLPSGGPGRPWARGCVLQPQLSAHTASSPRVRVSPLLSPTTTRVPGFRAPPIIQGDLTSSSQSYLRRPKLLSDFRSHSWALG